MKLLLAFSVLLVFLCSSLRVHAEISIDNFDGDQLKDVWNFNNRNNPNSTMEIEDGKLYIHVPAGGNDLIPGKELAPTLTMENPYSGDYSLSILYTGPTASAAAAGISIYQDIANQIQLLYGIGGPGGENVWLMGFTNWAIPVVKDENGNIRGAGWGGHLFTGNLGAHEKVYLKITKSGDKYTSYYRLDDAEEWVQWLSADFPLQNPEIGFVVKNWGGGAELTAEFDFFQIETETFDVRSQNSLPNTWGAIKSGS